MNKRGVILVFLFAFLIFNSLLISAIAGGIPANSVEDPNIENTDNSEECGILTQTDCNNENGVILFRLSDYQNAHTEIATINSYEPYVFCCSNSYEIVSDGEEMNDNNELIIPQTCSGNKLIGLFSEYNSHVEGPAESFYDYPICYGDLECQVGSKDTYSRILSISGETNAHVAYPGYYNYDIYCNVDYWADYGKLPMRRKPMYRICSATKTVHQYLG